MLNRQHPVRSWTVATFLGWILGVPVIAALALVGEAMHIGGAQALVGAGLGLALGIVQARKLRGIVERPHAWIMSSTIGLAAPFLISDISRLAQGNLPYSLPAFVLLGGLIVAVWQARILQARLSGTWAWIVASAIGWTLAAAAALIADSSHFHAIRGLAGAVAYLGMIAIGGVILGILTGIALSWMLRRAATADLGR